MVHILGALIPIFILIAIGAALRTWFFRGESFWQPITQLTYFILFPALFISLLSEMLIDWAVVGPMFGILVVVILTILGFLLIARPHLGCDGAGFSSIVQGSIRFNSYVGLSAIAAMHGKAAISLMVVVMALTIPIVNLISVFVLAWYAGRTRLTLKETLRELALNPLIISSLIGLSISASGVSVPGLVRSSLDIIGKASLPMGLLAVGAGLDLKSVRGSGRSMAAAGALKLLVMPALAWAGGRALGVDPLAMTIIVLYAAQPTATSAFILARVMGGDHALMAGMITLQTVLASTTMPLALTLLK